MDVTYSDALYDHGIDLVWGELEFVSRETVSQTWNE